MVRIKFTGPPSTVQVHAPQNLHPLASSNRPVTRVRAPNVVEVPPRLTLQESIHLKQQQSLEMVQIMLHVSFGTLFYLREFLPLPCFDDRDLREAQRESRLSYRQFIDKKAHGEALARNAEVPFGRGKQGQPLKIILRGSDPKADMILDILETGIFDALSRNVLEAVQLTILVDKDAPDNVLESYTFSFKYTGEAGDVNSRLESLSIEPVGCVADMKSAQAARIGLETIVRRLITLSAFLPTLPNKRNLGVHLFYTDDCPPEYDPPGFNGAANDDTIQFPLNDNWKRESQSCGQMDSGWHTVGLKVTSLKWTGPESEGSEDPPHIPPDLEYNDPMRRLADVGFDDKEDLVRTLGSRPNTSVENRLRPDDDLSLPPSREINDNGVSTQDLVEKHQLQMMLPSQGTGGSDSELAPTQPLKPNITLENDNESPTKSQKFALTDESRHKVQEYIHLHDLDAWKKEDQGTVRCQCGWDGEEAAMVECAFCRTRQHMLCYGYEGAQDPRVPDVHSCYQCLLKPEESRLLREMNSLVLLRRAVRIIQEEGYPSRTSLFTQKLHCNGQTIVQITEILRKRKFLQPTPGNKAKGFLRKGLPKFIIPSSEKTQQRLQEEILNPMIKIQHHYAQDSPQKSHQLSQPVTGDELDSIAKSLSHENEEEDSTSETQEDGNKTPCSTEEPTEVLNESQGRKKKGSLINGHGQANTTETAAQSDAPTPRRFSDRILRKDSKAQEQQEAKGVKLKVFQQQTPTRRKSSEGSLRRSSRKRRKISNYSKLVDVGADNSENDSA
ncbi:meiosis specific protein Hop1 [Aspergillus sclerotioniger CBS 115572]|uniref:Meiosis specific protein Hop1 n=1 Tax=Aspergillus sclerotioniger CBS 115572 TaxID=1450535 RepID=A0A317X859_9EURO|nr:meiosis specific protein Hop1 [Aspergillus sclerotioniger CBS 115572]PWY94465.1 meiosis specific protein Hop1 [Aspergillus sclerotioniger CBS 115572]